MQAKKDIAIQFESLAVMDEQAQAWQEALDLWLSSRRSLNTRTAYEHGLMDLLKFSSQVPWELGRADVARWVSNMHARELSGNTISQRLAAVSSFYQFTMTEITHVDPDSGKEVPLHYFNPAAGKDLRPKVSPYGKAVYLNDSEARALLKAIDRDNLQGLRDYALFLGYLFTARRNSEWRVARWGDFEPQGTRIQYRWSGKGKTDQRLDVPPPVWNAVQAYLAAAGKTPTRKDFLFTPLSNNATRLPNVDTGKWNTNHPITAREVGRILKNYARKAGLDPVRLHVHTLRHTGAMLRKEAGDDIEQISEFLGHSSVAITQIYMHSLEGKTDESWGAVANLLGL